MENKLSCTCGIDGFSTWLRSIENLKIHGGECAAPQKFLGRSIKDMMTVHICDTI